MNISVCTDMLCPQLDTAEAVRSLAPLGVRYIEFWGWQNKDLTAIRDACRQHGVQVAAICTAAFDLTDPARRAEYLDGLRRSIPAAQQLACPVLITQVGPDRGTSREEQHRSIAEGLTAAAQLLQGTGVTLAIEPLNLRVDHPGYYLSSSEEAFRLVHEVDRPEVRVLFDIYHQQVTEGDILSHVLPNLDCIAHFHAAGCPGRHELESGELAYPRLLRRIADAGYTGRVGLEYAPVRADWTGLRADLAALAAVGLQ